MSGNLSEQRDSSRAYFTDAGRNATSYVEFGSSDKPGRIATGLIRLRSKLPQLPDLSGRQKLRVGVGVVLAAGTIAAVYGLAPSNPSGTVNTTPGISSIDGNKHPQVVEKATGSDRNTIIQEAKSALADLNSRFFSTHHQVISEPIADVDTTVRATKSLTAGWSKVDATATFKGQQEQIIVLIYPDGPDSRTVLLTIPTNGELSSEDLKGLLNGQVAKSMPTAQIVTDSNGGIIGNSYTWNSVYDTSSATVSPDVTVITTVDNTTIAFSTAGIYTAVDVHPHAPSLQNHNI